MNWVAFLNMPNWEHFIGSTLTLLIILDPLGNAPPTQSVLQGVAPRRRRFVLLRETFFMMLLLLLFFLLGSSILRYFGFSTGALNISGGILLLLIAVGLIFPKLSVLEGGGDDEAPSQHEPFLVPITVPLVVGPAAIAFVMLQATLCNSRAETVAYMLGIVLACAVTGGLLMFSEHAISRLGKNASAILARLMGTLLVLLAVQMCLNGITLYIESLQAVAPAVLP